MSARRGVLVAALALAACAPATSMTGPAGPIPERCAWTGRYPGAWVFEEEERIVAYFAPTNLEEYRRTLPGAFAMPERPLVRLSVIDFYGMSNGATYLESEISVVGLHRDQPGFFVVTMPVTDGDSCAGGRFGWGYPKLVRRITLERQRNRYVGVVYASGGQVPELTLAFDAVGGNPGGPAMDVLGLVGPMPNFTLKDGRVLSFGGGRRPVQQLESWAPTVYRVSLGRATLELPREPEHLLRRLGIGQPLAAFWLRQRARYSISAN